MRPCVPNNTYPSDTVLYSVLRFRESVNHFNLCVELFKINNVLLAYTVHTIPAWKKTSNELHSSNKQFIINLTLERAYRLCVYLTLLYWYADFFLLPKLGFFENFRYISLISPGGYYIEMGGGPRSAPFCALFSPKKHGNVQPAKNL
jgi:hypothetical protein